MRFLLTALLFFAPVAFADFNGSWTGPGTLGITSDDDGLTMYDCASVQVDIAQTVANLTFNTISYSCTRGEGEEAGLSYAKMDFEISGTDLMFGGEKVGTISDTKIVLSYEDVDIDYRTTQTFELTNGILGFTDRDETVSDGAVMWDLNSSLMPSSRAAFHGLRGR